MKDGDEKRIECELVLGYQAEDHSVGINGGFYVVGLQLGDQLLEIEEKGAGGLLHFDIAGSKALQRVADDASEDDENYRDNE